ncbi:hypothetical protein HOG16_01270 [Candidatus Woesearchaeota archaeon]|nr:hypothetical protein [Candidatus Woesearchaeota archaeon]MBT4321764.1 hypothetical protein [Candidatus Woesearchaeota archaeon]
MEEVNRMYLWIGYSLLSIAVFFIITMALVNLGNNNAVYQNLISRDVAFIESAILTSEGDLDLRYTYSKTEKEFKVETKSDCEVRVGSIASEYSYEGYYCLNNEFVDKGDSISSSLDPLIFELKGNKLLIYGDTSWLDIK